MGVVCAIPLMPWAIRNAVTLHEFQPLAPKNSNLPGELVPYGFMSWEKTWLYRFRDVYLVPWKLNDEAIRHRRYSGERIRYAGRKRARCGEFSSPITMI